MRVIQFYKIHLYAFFINILYDRYFKSNQLKEDMELDLNSTKIEKPQNQSAFLVGIASR